MAAQELSLCGSLSGWKMPDVEVLAELGWTVTKLATLKGCKLKVLDSVLDSARKHKGDFGQDVSGLRELVERCNNRPATIHRADASRGSQDLLEAHVEHQREKRRKVLEVLQGQEVAERVKLVGSAKVYKWPTRLGKMLHVAGTDLALREAAEKAERDRWLAVLRELCQWSADPQKIR